MKLKDVLRLLFAIGVAELAGIIGAVFTTSAITTWYADLVRPEFAPPNWVFGPVWTALYALMGVAIFLIWRAGWERRDVKIASVIFAVQLVLNTLWSIIFFGFRSPGLAFIEIVILWIAILATIIAFAKISRLSAWLLAPYILWVSFAAYINFAIWSLNV